MSALTVAGGVYHEHCIWPDWDQIYGSGGRAAAALSGHVDSITLRTYARPDTAERIATNAAVYGFNFDPVSADQTVSFEYIHSLSIPVIRPAPALIRLHAPFPVSGDVVLRFGMMEGSAVVEADRCVYDPQSAFHPERFNTNGSNANHLAIVANRSEVLALGCGSDPIASAKTLLNEGAEVVIVKLGVEGAIVVEPKTVTPVPAYKTEQVWKIGSGDVFAAMFAAAWGVRGKSPVDAVNFVSRAVAEYVTSMALPIPSAEALQKSKLPPATAGGGRNLSCRSIFHVRSALAYR